MPKGWRITVKYGPGKKTIVDVGLPDLAQAEAVALNHVGSGNVLIQEALSDADFEGLLAAGKLIGLTSNRSR
jgi:hypothetical protein